MITIEAINGVLVQQRSLNLSNPARDAVVHFSQTTHKLFNALTNDYDKRIALLTVLAAVSTALEVDDIAEITEDAIEARLDNIDIREVSEDPAR